MMVVLMVSSQLGCTGESAEEIMRHEASRIYE